MRPPVQRRSVRGESRFSYVSPHQWVWCASLCFINRDALRFYFLLPDYEMACFHNPVRRRVVVEDIGQRTASADPDTFWQRPGIETGCFRHVEKDILREGFVERSEER